MKKILTLIEKGEWKKYPAIASMSLEQIQIMADTVREFEQWGIGYYTQRKIIN